MEGDWLHATLNIDKDVMRLLDWVDDPRMTAEEIPDLTNQDKCDIIDNKESENTGVLL